MEQGDNISSAGSEYDTEPEMVEEEEEEDEKMITLAKIFMSTPNPANSQRPLIAEWDGENPGHTKRLFVYAHIDNSTYEAYVTLSDESRKLLTYVNTLGDGRPFHRGYDKLMQTGPFSNYLESCIHNPRGYWPNYPELETVLRNLMSGTLSFENDRDVLDRHRIYVFDPPITTGIEHSRHFPVSKPALTYWYRLNNTRGQDKVTQGPPGGETIRDIPEDEFMSLYRIFSKFNIANPNTFLLNRESFGHLGKRPEGIGKKTTKYRPLHDPNRGPGSKVPGHSRGLSSSHRGGKKHSKRRNRTRRKYRKIKSRRRRP